MKKKRPKKKKRAGKPYKTRARNLKRMGFTSYREYLESELWAGIRQRVFTRDNHECLMCGREATQVHHKRYNMDTMKGVTIDHLVSSCGGCHYRVEFKNGKRRARIYNVNAATESRIDNHERTSALHDELDRQMAAAIAAD
jgi:5-methylcytosine-specific restriction endonuclease McrA